MLNAIRNVFSKSYEDLKGPDFKKKCEESSGVLIDVRTPGEVAAGTIAGSMHIDIMSPGFTAKINQLDKDKSYFLFCRSGNRSGKACEYMTGQGFKAYNLAGGIGEWPGA